MVKRKKAAGKRTATRKKAAGGKPRRRHSDIEKRAKPARAVWLTERIEAVPVGRLREFEANPRLHSDEQVAQLARSIEAFGFLSPVVVRGDVIAAGHARVRAARLLGMAHVPVVDAAHLTDAQLKAFVIADNKLTLNATWEWDGLSELLPELSQAGLDPTLSGFDTTEIDAIINGWQPDNETPHPSTSDGPVVTRIVVTCSPDHKERLLGILDRAISESGIEGIEVQR